MHASFCPEGTHGSRSSRQTTTVATREGATGPTLPRAAENRRRGRETAGYGGCVLTRIASKPRRSPFLFLLVFLHGAAESYLLPQWPRRPLVSSCCLLREIPHSPQRGPYAGSATCCKKHVLSRAAERLQDSLERDAKRGGGDEEARRGTYPTRATVSHCSRPSIQTPFFLPCPFLSSRLSSRWSPILYRIRTRPPLCVRWPHGGPRQTMTDHEPAACSCTVPLPRRVLVRVLAAETSADCSFSCLSRFALFFLCSFSPNSRQASGGGGIFRRTE